MSAPIPIAAPPAPAPAVPGADAGAEQGQAPAEGFAALLGGLAGDAGSPGGDEADDPAAEEIPAAPPADACRTSESVSATAAPVTILQSAVAPVSAVLQEEISVGEGLSTEAGRGTVPMPVPTSAPAAAAIDATVVTGPLEGGEETLAAQVAAAGELVVEVPEEPAASKPVTDMAAAPTPEEGSSGAEAVAAGVSADLPDAGAETPDQALTGEQPRPVKEPGTPAGRPAVDGRAQGTGQPDVLAADAEDGPARVVAAEPESSAPEPRPDVHPPRGDVRMAARRSDEATQQRVAVDPAPPSTPPETASRTEQVVRSGGHVAEPAPLRQRVSLAQLAEEARAVIRLTAAGGLSTARITLSPPELGQVEIRLRYRAGGVVAELTAESAQAAQALGQSSGDLRRSLEQQGLTVLGLDIRHAGPEARENAHGGDERSGSGPSQHGDDLTEDAAATEALASLQGTAGVQIDVLA